MQPLLLHMVSTDTAGFYSAPTKLMVLFMSAVNSMNSAEELAPLKGSFSVAPWKVYMARHEYNQ